MSKTTSFILGNELDEFVKSEVDSGHYKNASELLREGLRLLMEKKKAREHIIKMVEEARESGINEDFDPGKHRKNLRAKYKNL